MKPASKSTPGIKATVGNKRRRPFEGPGRQTSHFIWHASGFANFVATITSGRRARELTRDTSMSTTMKNARSKTAQPMSDELNSELATLFEHQLKDTYFAEKAITKALPKMIKAAHSNELKRAFEKHLEQTQGHVARLESVFQMIGRKAEGTTCQAIKGIIEEGDEVAKMFGKTGAADAGLAASAQAVEHYEIARYGTLKAWAHELGLNEAADLLEFDRRGRSRNRRASDSTFTDPQRERRGAIGKFLRAANFGSPAPKPRVAIAERTGGSRVLRASSRGRFRRQAGRRPRCATGRRRIPHRLPAR